MFTFLFPKNPWLTAHASYPPGQPFRLPIITPFTK